MLSLPIFTRKDQKKGEKNWTKISCCSTLISWLDIMLRLHHMCSSTLALFKRKKEPLFLSPHTKLKTPQTTKLPQCWPHRGNLTMSSAPLLPTDPLPMPISICGKLASDWHEQCEVALMLTRATCPASFIAKLIHGHERSATLLSRGNQRGHGHRGSGAELSPSNHSHTSSTTELSHGHEKKKHKKRKEEEKLKIKMREGGRES